MPAQAPSETTPTPGPAPSSCDALDRPQPERALEEMANLASRVAGEEVSRALLQRLREEFGGLRALLRLPAARLSGSFGLTRPALGRLEDALCLSIYAAQETDERLLVCSAADIYERFAFLSLEASEAFWLASLDAANRLSEVFPIAHGGAQAIRLDPADVLEACVTRGARRVVAVHNHPGGSADASQQDLAFTRKLIRASRLLGVHLLDHVIVGHGVYSSMRDRALLPFDD